jgi:aryl-alcohol dehydrogenase-like predicted oxidoreductase
MLVDPVITSPIIGPNKLTQLMDNLGALNVQLTAEEKDSLDQITRWQKREED